MSIEADKLMVAIVLVQIRKGANVVYLPKSVAIESTSEGREAVKDLCEINEVQLELTDE